MNRWYLGGSVFSFVVGFATLSHGGHELAGRDIAIGTQLYSQHCAACHGPNLEGQPNWQTPDENGVLPAPPHDETGHTWHHDNSYLIAYTQLGGEKVLEIMGVDNFESAMPAFQGVLTDAEILDVLAYIQSTWPEEIKQVQRMRSPPHE